MFMGYHVHFKCIQKYPIRANFNPLLDPETIKLVEETMEKYSLMDYFLQLQIPFVADAALRHALDRIFSLHGRSSIKSICTDHNFTCLGKRAAKKFIIYLGDNRLVNELDSTMKEAEKAFSTFFKNQEVEEVDRDLIGQLKFPNWNQMSEETKQNATLRYGKIPKLKEIRFRNPQERSQGLLTWMPLLRRIQADEDHELHSFVEPLHLKEENHKFLIALHKLQTHLLQQIDYYEGNDTFQTTDSLNSMLFCFEFSLDFDRTITCKYEVATKMALFDCLCEQLFSHTAKKTESGYEWEKCSVPERIGRMDKIGMFAFRSRQNLKLNRLSKMLGDAGKKNRQYKPKFEVSSI